MLLAILQSVSLLPIAWLVRRAFDSAIPHGDVRDLLLLGLCILLLTAGGACLALVTRLAALRTTKLAIAAIRRDLVTHCHALPRTYHDTANRSELHTLMVQDTQLLDVMLNAFISFVLPSLVLCVGLIALMAILNARLLGLLALVTPVLFLANRSLASAVKLHVVRNRDSFARFSSGVQFMLRRIDLTHYQSAEAMETGRQHENIESLRIHSGRMAWLQTAYGQAHTAAVMLAGIMILVVGGMQVAGGHLSVGSLLSFYVATLFLNSSLQQFFSSVPQLIEGHQALAALSSFAGEDASPLYTGTEKSAIRGLIELDSVSFSYGRWPVLEDVSLRLEPGSVTAIVGPNGAGKTTVARLILGLYRPQSGRILADGVPYDHLDIAWLRRHIAFTPQDPILFAGTIWENITYGLSMQESDEYALRACQAALVDQFVRLLPRGYNTSIDDDGGVISGGQRQKIAIARALARRPRLLILDEPTNHLDGESVQKLLENLDSLPGHPAVLVITQDLNFAQISTQRYLLDGRRLISNQFARITAPGPQSGEYFGADVIC
ncbi:MAG: ABC transporter ATP-binding protein [Terracidiphilus sp.]